MCYPFVCIVNNIFFGGISMKNRSLQAFTLAELLVSLSVLGLVAAFAIPKVLLSVSDQSTKAAGREAFAMLNDAFMAYKATKGGIVDSGASGGTLFSFINYKQELTASTTPTFDQGLTLSSAATPTTELTVANGKAYEMLNGLVVAFRTADDMTENGTTNKGTLGFEVDPDGTGSAEPITIFLASDGRAWAAYAYDAGAGGAVNGWNATYGITTTNEPNGIASAGTGLYTPTTKTSWWVS